MNHFKKILKIIAIIAITLVVIFLGLSAKKDPDQIFYGVSFSKFHSDELKLPWKDVYKAILDDLGVRRFRLSAHWPITEPERGNYNFSELDYQVEEAQKRNAEVILVVGRRAPGWPECHEPQWATQLPWEERKEAILSYVEATVNHYKGYENIKYWQVENEPFLSVFAKEQCGDFDEDFFKEEVSLVKKLDPSRNILVTDSGNLGLWANPWRSGDIFGTSVYIYLWNPTIGQVKTVYLPSFYKAKANLMELIFGKKKSILIELSTEPWLLAPIVDSPLDVQISRMDIEKFNSIISFAEGTGFDEQYLWGAEWWYWMKDRGHPEYWARGKEIFSNSR
ncbi:MAG: hypothetical protein CO184_00780 [Candidatus Zambryskibacteria bacterium CG_4_9_14_3_um_filter_40_16]|uniref:GH10 domain-containing protein n=2 Tax=Candidatus Zambryskiibacteriota TaxID=1817925 RepID=A0A2H0K6I9_9BACT|nr:MAG: hypothetical protein COV95_01835 [Candidatus Zambryskibacteria bacterium CG11_big_fil_rev_8_21_14_0_20_40_24]PJA33911.1 MAG: hypothetical protein CO184_00780 [Candidatus Zambryskibacteria bacterium CG_4_9_14_3_um_filter_40_16]